MWRVLARPRPVCNNILGEIGDFHVTSSARIVPLQFLGIAVSDFRKFRCTTHKKFRECVVSHTLLECVGNATRWRIVLTKTKKGPSFFGNREIVGHGAVGVWMHRDIQLGASIGVIPETKYKRSRIAFSVISIALSLRQVGTRFLEIIAQSLIGSPGDNTKNRT